MSGTGEQAVASLAGMAVDLAFASSIKKDQKRFESEIAKLDQAKQAELVAKLTQANTELERQKIVFQYIDKNRIEELKNKDDGKKKYIYIAFGVAIILYGLLILKNRKNE